MIDVVKSLQAWRPIKYYHAGVVFPAELQLETWKLDIEKYDWSCKENTSTGSIVQKGITQEKLRFHVDPFWRERL